MDRYSGDCNQSYSQIIQIIFSHAFKVAFSARYPDRMPMYMNEFQRQIQI